MVTEESAAKPKKKRERSPAYPGIDLKEALERASQIYAAEKKYLASVGTILSHWGYRPNSSEGFVILSALKKFGLILDEGTGDKRKARLTEEAVAILVDDRDDSPERLKLIQRAALKPSIHQELWDKYGEELPSDANLRYELRTERHFSESGANDFIEQYKRTIQFAKLSDSDNLSEDSRDKQGGLQVTPPTTTITKEHEASEKAKPPSDQQARRAVALPIGQEWAVLEAAFPITQDEWDQMIAVLEAMKPGLTVEK